MPVFGKRKPPYNWDREPDDHHFTVDLTPVERAALIEMLEQKRTLGSTARRYLARKLKDAVRREGQPLPAAALDWRRAEREAEARGESIPEWLFDGAKPPPDRAA